MRVDSLLVLLIGYALRFLPAHPAPPVEQAALDRQQMQGEWKPAVLEVFGQRVPAQHIAEWKMVVSGDRLTGYDGDKVLDQARFLLDPNRKPRAIQIVYDVGPSKGVSMRGIYEIDGDTLRICVSERGQENPREFLTREDSDLTLVVLRRKK
jgi:uncharacterized protein (TIGR03067 family)